MSDHNQFLIFLNSIMNKCDKQPILNITDFVMDREELIKFNIEDDDKIYRYIKKSECGWYRRKSINNYILTFLRYYCEKSAFQFKYKQLSITEDVIDKNNVTRKAARTHIIYYIK